MKNLGGGGGGKEQLIFSHQNSFTSTSIGTAVTPQGILRHQLFRSNNTVGGGTNIKISSWIFKIRINSHLQAIRFSVLHISILGMRFILRVDVVFVKRIWVAFSGQTLVAIGWRAVIKWRHLRAVRILLHRRPTPVALLVSWVNVTPDEERKLSWHENNVQLFFFAKWCMTVFCTEARYRSKCTKKSCTRLLEKAW